MEQQEKTKEIRNNENERQMEREWLALRSGMLSVELQGTVCPPVFWMSILNKHAKSLLKAKTLLTTACTLAAFQQHVFASCKVSSLNGMKAVLIV